MAGSETRDPLEDYRMYPDGDARGDFATCQVAISAQCDGVAMVLRALDGMCEETANNEHAQVLLASCEVLGRAVRVMNRALSVLADCEVV